MTCEGEEYTDYRVSYGKGEDGGVVEVMYVAASDEAGLVLGDASSTILLELVFPRAADGTHMRDENNKSPRVFDIEGGVFFVGSEKLVSVVGAFDSLLVRRGIDNGEGACEEEVRFGR
jgi:hypothetical protein